MWHEPRLCEKKRHPPFRYLNYEDLKRLVYESTFDLVASVTSDSDYVSTGDDVSVSALIERELAREEASTEDLTPLMWDSVFWDPAWARPDRITSYLNRSLRRDLADNDTFVLSEQDEHQVWKYRNIAKVGEMSSGKKILIMLRTCTPEHWDRLWS